MVSLVASVLTVLVMYVTNCYTQNVAYRCYLDSTSQLSMEIRELKVAGTVEALKGYDPVNVEAGTSCTASEEMVNGNTYLLLTIKTDSNKAQVEPASPSVCHVVDPDTNVGDSNIVEYNILRQGSSGTLSVSDTYYTVQCDADNVLSQSEATLTDQGITVSGVIQQDSTLTETNGGVTLSLLDETDQVISGSVNLGQTVKFQITYTREANGARPVFIQVTSLIAADSSSFDGNTIDILNSNGCPYMSAFNISSGVTVDSTVISNFNPESTTSVVGVTGAFSMVVFDTVMTSVSFRVSYDENCFSTTEDKCFNSPNYCAGLKRRKRSTQAAGNGTIDLTVNVKVNGGSGSSSLGGGKSETQAEKDCEAMTSYWIVSVVLAVLLILVLVFAVMLFYRLRMERGTKTFGGDQDGVRNPTF